MLKNLIWQNYDLTESENYIKDNVGDFFYDMEVDEMIIGQPTEDEIREKAEEENDFDFECEMENLKIPINGDMIIIADLGLWDGRKSGYKIVHNAKVKDIFAHGIYDYAEFGSNGKDIVCKTSHHDGDNHYTYRKIRQRNGKSIAVTELTDKLYNQEEVTEEDIKKYTSSILPYVKSVYGWSTPKTAKYLKRIA
jgi:hypothetical protein